MPELPDVTVYCQALERYVGGEELEGVRLGSPFVLRSVAPPLTAAAGKRVVGIRRIGKRIVLALDEDLFLVVHLMITGRLRWRPRKGGRSAMLPRRRGLAAFDFAAGSLLLTEEGTNKRASLHLVDGEAALAAHDPGGLEVLEASARAFRERLASRNHTLKRALTDPRILSGIGNAYSDEILHQAARDVLREWIERLAADVGDNFPEKVTAFHPEMAVHGRYGEPCPQCGAPVQRIVYAENEANYCATCQTGGKLLADRALSQILKDDWPMTLDGWEQLKGV